jgi:hypothetical protein
VIKTDEEFEFERRQLNMFEDGLVSLRREMLPQESRNYWYFAQGIVAMIRKLRADLDAYLEIDSFQEDVEPVDDEEASVAVT